MCSAAALDLTDRLVAWILCIGLLLRILIIYPRWALQLFSVRLVAPLLSIDLAVGGICGSLTGQLAVASAVVVISACLVGDQCLRSWRVGSAVVGSIWCPQLLLLNSVACLLLEPSVVHM